MFFPELPLEKPKMGKLNPILHQELRLSIVSYLANVDWADFNKLLEISKATKGNLSAQISKLEGNGIIKVEKTFKGKYPHTKCRITAQGLKAYKDYLKNLKAMLNL